MKTPFFIFFLAVVTEITGTCDSRTKITCGQIASRGMFPYQVSIQEKSLGHFCGGSIIDSRHVLTAAHCVKDYHPSDIIVWTGDIELYKGGIVKKVQHIFVHDYFDMNSDYIYNDVAIIRISGTFNETEYVKYITLSNNTFYDGQRCRVSGWGSIQENVQIASRDLLFADVRIVNQNICKQEYGSKRIRNGMVCAGLNGRDACQGDSGGPLACNGQLVGIVSFGIGCGRPDYAGVYTNVYHYRSWIKQQMARSGVDGDTVSNIQITAMFIAVTLYATLFK